MLKRGLPFIPVVFINSLCVGLCSLYFLFARHMALRYASDEIAWIKTRQSGELRSTRSPSSALALIVD